MSINEYEKGKKVRLVPEEKGIELFSTDFDCHCTAKNCVITYVDSDLVDKYVELCQKWQVKSLRITSGFRCTAHNAKVGGKAGSRHLVGKAMDFDYTELEKKVEFNKIIEDVQCFGGLGVSLLKKFIHGDVRNTHARWRYI